MLDLVTLVTRHAGWTPHAPALIDGQSGDARSFRALAERAGHLGRALVPLMDGAQNSRVAAISRNRVEMLELYLGVASAGGMLFPLNWRLSGEQLRETLLEADPAVVFYDSEFRDVVAELQRWAGAATWVEWSSGEASPYEDLVASGSRSTSPLPTADALRHAPFLALSTGGTTGVIKSAVHSQYSYTAALMNYLTAAHIQPTDVFMQLGALFHVTGYMPLAYLAMGRPAVLADFAADTVLDIVERERVSGFLAVATMLPRLVAAIEGRSRDLSSVRQIEYGGAPIAPEVLRAAAGAFDAELLHGWGMTEMGPGSYLTASENREALSGERPELLRSCGRPALYSELRVVDESGQPVPQDARSVGELCHRGPSNMIGYWRKPEETALMIRDGWLHTGDAATWDDEGHIFIVDRIKSMIISGGENIFPAEIERLLGRHEGISEVVVVGAPDPEWGEVVKAVVVRAVGSHVTESDVSSYVEQHLASYKKPRVVEFRDELPMTPTGKVDRKALVGSP
jgi:acyl-CoA synthetase (AMP-forming)/AMP-acid ligase II